jgi:hypothetical protein
MVNVLSTPIKNRALRSKPQRKIVLHTIYEEMSCEDEYGDASAHQPLLQSDDRFEVSWWFQCMAGCLDSDCIGWLCMT